MGMLTRRRVLAAQSSYYLGTGLWPLLDRRSFEAVTGPKTDFWLVETVGAMVAAIGAGLALAARRDRLPDELRVTAITAAAGLGLVDQHKLVYDALSDPLADGTIHELRITTRSEQT